MEIARAWVELARRTPAALTCEEAPALDRRLTRTDAPVNVFRLPFVLGRGSDTGGCRAGWETADGPVAYGDNASLGVDTGDNIPSYADLGSLPADPAALAAIPAVTVDSHVTAIDGRAGAAFVFPATLQSDKQVIILDAANYSFLAHASWGPGGGMTEVAVVRMVIVGAPGSTGPSLTPPTAAELLAEQADRAVTVTNGPLLLARAGSWILREQATSAGHQPVWATADDSKQASHVNGQLQVARARRRAPRRPSG